MEKSTTEAKKLEHKMHDTVETDPLHYLVVWCIEQIKKTFVEKVSKKVMKRSWGMGRKVGSMKKERKEKKKRAQQKRRSIGRKKVKRSIESKKVKKESGLKKTVLVRGGYV